MVQKCEQAAQAIGMPPTALLAGLLMIVGFAMSHSVVEVEGTEWMEPVLLWLSVCMPTGSGKSSLCKLLRQIVKDAREQCGLREDPTSWTLDDQSFEKNGRANAGQPRKTPRPLYDELPMFLAQVNICSGRALADSQQVAIFLQLYGADSWVRRTGMCLHAANFGPRGSTDTCTCGQLAIQRVLSEVNFGGLIKIKHLVW